MSNFPYRGSNYVVLIFAALPDEGQFGKDFERTFCSGKQTGGRKSGL